MKPRSKSVWITPAACGAVAPRLIVQARASFGPAVRNVCRPSVAKPTRASWSSPDSSWPIDCSSSSASSSGSSISSDSVLASRKIASAGATSARSSSVNAVFGDLVRVDVEDVEERLGRHQVQLAQRLAVEAGREDRLAGLQHLLRLLDRRDERALVLLQPRLLLQPRQRLLDRLQVGEDQLGVDRLDVVRAGETLPSTCTTSGSLNARITWQIASASRMLARNLLPSPAPSLAPLHDAGDVDERHGRRDDLGRVEDLRPGRRAAGRGRRRRRCSARSWRTGSWPRGRRSWSAR